MPKDDKEIKISIHVINKNCCCGERLQGYALLKVSKRVIVTDMNFQIIGETVLAHNYLDKKSIRETRRFYASEEFPPFQEQEQKKQGPYFKEYFVGTYAIPFSFIIPNLPHPTVHLKGDIGCFYKIQFNCMIVPIKIYPNDDIKTRRKATFTGTTDVEILCRRMDNFPSTKVDGTASERGVLVKISVPNGVKPNEPVKCLVIISNNTGKPFKPVMLWYSELNYRETQINISGGIRELEPVNKLLQREYILETTAMMPTIKEGEFELQNFVEIMITQKKKPTIMLKVPFQIGWCSTTTIGNKQRADVMGLSYPPQIVPFYGAHCRDTPACPSPVQQTYTDDGQVVYVNHLWRRVYLDKDCKQLTNIRYPLPECFKLPKGWGIGMDRNEMYFINWNRRYTTWCDPRTFEQREWKVNNLAITLRKGINFPTMKGKEAQFIAVVIDKNGDQVKSSISTKSVNPEWLQDQSFFVQLEPERENVIVAFFGNGKFFGGINLPLWRVCQNGTEEWFQLRNFGDFTVPNTAEVLVRFSWEGDIPSTEDEKVHMRFVPYYCNTEANRETEKYINKILGRTDIKFTISGQELTYFTGTMQESGYDERTIPNPQNYLYDVDGIGRRVNDEKFDIPNQRLYTDVVGRETVSVVPPEKEEKKPIPSIQISEKVESSATTTTTTAIRVEHKKEHKHRHKSQKLSPREPIIPPESFEERKKLKEEMFKEKEEKIKKIKEANLQKKKEVETMKDNKRRIEEKMKEIEMSIELTDVELMTKEDEISTINDELMTIDEVENKEEFESKEQLLVQAEKERDELLSTKDQQQKEVDKYKTAISQIDEEIIAQEKKNDNVEIQLFRIEEKLKEEKEEFKKEVELAEQKLREAEEERLRKEEEERKRLEEEERMRIELIHEEEERLRAQAELEERLQREEEERHQRALEAQQEAERLQKEEEERKRKEEKRKAREEHEKRKAERQRIREERAREAERKKKEEESKAASFGVVDQMGLSNSEKELLGLV